MIRQTVIAYWLIPSEPAHGFFQQIITDLACRYDAPAFEPHVTVHVGADQLDTVEKALEGAARECKPIALTPLGIDQSDEFIKTLFVRFSMNAELRNINGIIRQAANDSCQYELKPHLSLLYKNLAAAIRRELAGSITVPFPEISLESLKAIRCVSPTQNRTDVESWQILASRMLR
jgi:putative hydrolase of the HAD superfamily